MEIETYTTADGVARRTAELIAEAAREGERLHGRSVLAFSGGSTPAPMLAHLATLPCRWNATYVVQVDERVAPDGHPDRNWTMITEHLLDAVDIPRSRLCPMPVTNGDLDAAAMRYERQLQIVAGTPPIADVVHLGIGTDGHTASLIPGDPVLNVRDRWVATSGPYEGRLRMTLTYSAINAARTIVWQVTSAEKAGALREALYGRDVPASKIRRYDVHVVATTEAAALLSRPR